MGFYRNKHPPPPENKQKDSYPASSQAQRGPVQLFSGISNVHRGKLWYLIFQELLGNDNYTDQSWSKKI